MVNSMTGFARQEATHPWGTVSWEIRSVNHRYLEPHFRLPESFRAIEPALRNRLRKKLHRGKVEMSLSLQTSTTSVESLGIDLEMVKHLATGIRQVNALLDDASPVNALDVMQWPGVVKGQSPDLDDMHQSALQLFEGALDQLIDHRHREGAELAQLIEQRLVAVTEQVAKVRQLTPDILQAQREKLLERLDVIKTEDINRERLEQELVIYAQKADVDEELERLDTHVNEVRLALQQKGAIGRRLDFLMQELNREANTLSSKSIATDTTQSAVELKVLIEQMREQVQNIE